MSFCVDIIWLIQSSSSAIMLYIFFSYTLLQELISVKYLIFTVKIMAGKGVPEMTYFLLSGALNLDSSNQSVSQCVIFFQSSIYYTPATKAGLVQNKTCLHIKWQ